MRRRRSHSCPLCGHSMKRKAVKRRRGARKGRRHSSASRRMAWVRSFRSRRPRRRKATRRRSSWF